MTHPCTLIKLFSSYRLFKLLHDSDYTEGDEEEEEEIGTIDDFEAINSSKQLMKSPSSLRRPRPVGFSLAAASEVASLSEVSTPTSPRRNSVSR